MDGVKFKRMVRPGDTVEIEAKLKEQLSNAYFMTGKVTVAGKLAVRLEFACSIAPAVSGDAAPEDAVPGGGG
jgi:3-hydroxyacyl-[acyl-carrier-protein] dehydratase